MAELSKRDQFALAALTGLCAEYEQMRESYDLAMDLIVKRAWKIADLMLEARNDRPESA